MKRFLLLFTALLVTASMSFAQPAGTLFISGDPLGTDCTVYDTPGLVHIYVFHIYTSGATASQFMIYCTSGVAMTYLAEHSPYITIGNSQSGVAIAYGACVPSPHMVLDIQYFGQGLSQECSSCRVVPDPLAMPPQILVADCQEPPNLLTSIGGEIWINPDGSCHCLIPIQETSWGQIKSLYK
jgi:hypothetical protein